MRTTHRQTYARLALAVATAAITLAGGSTAAQERPPGLLNTLDVRSLVARGDPVDHDRLFVHFRVLWDRYLTDAERYDSQAGGFTGNPNHSSGGSTAPHPGLAHVSKESAKTVRELALYYKQLAEGVPATLPSDAARFQRGEGAPEPTTQELDAWAARARTRTDHLALEEYLRMVAARQTRTATGHIMQALNYRGGRLAQAATHHERMAGRAREAARRATNIADRHRQYAALGR